jgi:hypothetical protein
MCGLSRHVLDHAAFMSVASYTLLNQPRSLHCVCGTQFAVRSLGFGLLVPMAVSDDRCHETMGLYAGLAAMLIVLAFASVGSPFGFLS